MVSLPNLRDSTIPIASSSFKYLEAALRSTPNLLITNSILE
jgi:hypothetical protein